MDDCFCDQTLLTPAVDNLGNCSSSPGRLQLSMCKANDKAIVKCLM